MRYTSFILALLSLVAGAAEHWSYQPIAKPVGNIDQFIREKTKLSPKADDATLRRRLSYDLTGLPPTNEKPLPLADYVDQLLASPRFGEKWARHWLDVARYAESNGRESNLTYPHAWRYRDYVIDAFNGSIPYDRFITEQIAGDLLPAKDDGERARLMIATGFLALGAKGLNEMNKEQFAADLADEQLDSVSRCILASSIACARCHDHKTDPFTMEDYYALVGIFKSTDTSFGTWIDSENNNGSHLLRLPGKHLTPNKSLDPKRVDQLKADLAKLNQQDKDLNAYIAKAKDENRDISGEFHKLLTETLRIYWTRGGVEGALETVDDQGNARALCMGVQDKAKPVDSPKYNRGELSQPGEAIPRRFPTSIPPRIPVPATQSGRLQLARWLTKPENPLTARVMVNRIWKQLLGKGLVRTVDDFGSTGEPPSHPELLDYLAQRFINSGWSIKAVIREIVLSDTYQQRSGQPPITDPDNRLFSVAPRRRLDAEAIRDSMLVVSGLLDTSRRPGSLVAALDGQSVSMIDFNTKLPPDLDGSHYRSVYLPVIRDHLPDVLEQFDVANPNLVTGERDSTNVPLQALYLLNGPFVLSASKALAKRAGSPEMAFKLCFQRPMDDKEHQLSRAFFSDTQTPPDQLLTAYCQALLASAEFRLLN
ncbi:MAG: DUF1553 domain-containing protein [Verrucomicrobiaceae bacterium]|nr:DUF1553 domain-containing protein [Verrucomicrobiaceae bacterium]